MRATGNGTRLPDGRYRVVVTLTRADGTKQRRYATAKTLREAQAKAQALRARFGKRDPGRHTLQDAYHAWTERDGPRWSPATRAQRAYVWTRLKGLAQTPVADLTPKTVARELERQAMTGVSGRTVQLVRALLFAACRFAVLEDWIPSNPVRETRTPVSAKPRRRPDFDDLDWQAVCDLEPDPRLAAFWRLLGESGLRPWREAAALTPEAGRRDGPLVWVEVGKSKTEAGTGRRVPVSPETWEAVAPHLPLKVQPNNARRSWRRTLAAAQAPAGTRVDELRKLAIRHWATLGLSDSVLQYLAGHTDHRLTLNVYAKLRNELQAAAELSRSVPKSMPPSHQTPSPPERLEPV